MNMKLSRVRRIWILILALSLTPVLAFAGDEAKPEAKPDKKERIKQLLAKPEVLFGNDFDVRGLKGPERRAVTVYRYEREVLKLQKLMVDQLKLTDLQKKAIDKLVKEQIAYLHFRGGSPRTFSGRQRDPLAEPGSPLAPYVPARGAPDPKKPNQMRTMDNIRERNRPSSSMFDDPTAMVNTLATELSATQMPQYSVLSYRWRVLRPFGAADGPLRQLSRAVRDPGLAIEDEERKAADKRVQEGMMTLGRDRQRADRRVAVYEKAKAEIAASMAPAQRKHFEKTLKELQTGFAEEVLVVMDLRAKSKGQEKAKKDAKGVKDHKKPTD